uniref:Family with sequence similarity 113 n=1 Tax=Macaca fascicularis TaxID=9541 RepID=A0A7N9CZ22_MACFA
MAQLRACEVRQLLHNKFVVVMGDSVQLAVYKDLVLLLQKDCLLSSSQLKAKGELSFERDMLLVGCSSGRMHYGRHYREVRQFRSGHHLVRFYFLTRVYSHYAERVVEELRRSEPAPDVVVMNSCLWDLARDGRGFPRSYRRDVESLFARLDWALPTSCLLLWNTAMPVADTISGSCLPCARHLRRAHLREDVMEANFYSSAEAERRGFDVLDLHFHFRHAARHRLPDGVHWDERAHRHLSQLLLAHLADAWGVDLPRREAVDGGSGMATPTDVQPRRAEGGPETTERTHTAEGTERAEETSAPPDRPLRSFPGLDRLSLPAARSRICPPTGISPATPPRATSDIEAKKTPGLAAGRGRAPSAQALPYTERGGIPLTVRGAPASHA